MDIITVSVLVLIIILFAALVLGRRLSTEVMIPSNQLNRLHVGSGPAEYALTAQLRSDQQYYIKTFSKFVSIATNDQALQETAMTYAVSNLANQPDAVGTLIKVDALKGELGTLVQNATIFSVAATCTHLIKGTSLTPGIAKNLTTEAGEKPYAPDLGWSTYITYLENAQPKMSAITRHVTKNLSKRKQNNVLSVMGYLIEQGEHHLALRREEFMR